MPNDLSNSELATGFLYDPDTDSAVYPLRPGIRVTREVRGDGTVHYRLETWGRLPGDPDSEPNRWVTSHSGPAGWPPDLAVLWAETAVSRPPERPVLCMGLRPGVPLTRRPQLTVH